MLRCREVECSVAFFSTSTKVWKFLRFTAGTCSTALNYMKSLLAAGLDSVLFSPFDVRCVFGVRVGVRGGAGLVLGLLLEKICTPPIDLALSFLSETQYFPS